MFPRATALALFATVVSAKTTCEDGTTELSVFLYDGVVRDLDPSPRDGNSDPICKLWVGDEGLYSKVLLNTNTPVFEAFFEFGCRAKDAPFRITCWDSDQPFLEVEREDQVAFRAPQLDAWPASGEKVALLDETRPDLWTMTVKFVYGSHLDADGAPLPEDEAEAPGSKKKTRSDRRALPVVILVASVLAARRQRGSSAPGPATGPGDVCFRRPGRATFAGTGDRARSDP